MERTYKTQVSKQIGYLTIKNIKTMIRDYIQLIWLFGYPLLFMLMYRFAFEEGVFALMTPGLLIAGPTIIIMQLSEHFATEKESGTLQRLITTPVPRSAILLSGLCSQLVVGTIQILIFIILIFLFGGEIHPDANLFIIFFIPFLMTFSVLGFGLLLASIVKNASSAGGISWFIILPLQFLGGVVTHPPFLPFIPSALAVNSLRSLLTNGVLTIEIGLNMLYIVIWGVVLIFIGILLFRRKTAIL
jgi:ABC-2 type transport system permease protein